MLDRPLFLHALSVRLQRKLLLHEVSFHLQPEQSLAIVGLNGAGKSTLLKTIMGLLPIYQGECRIFGKRPGNPQSRQAIFYLPERPALPLSLTGKEYVCLQLAIHNRQTMPKTLDTFLALLDLDPDSLAHRLQTYSKGMLQKLMLLGMILAAPQLIVLDEVMSGLDFRTRPKVRHLLREYQQQGGSLLFTTHLVEDVASFATHVLVLHQGHQYFYGTMEELRALTTDSTLEAILLDLLKVKA